MKFSIHKQALVKTMRYLVIFIFILSFKSNGQGQKLELEFGNVTNEDPTQLDSLFFFNTSTNKIEASYTNVPVINGWVSIKLNSGFYLITAKAKGFEFRRTDYAAVCSLCENKLRITSFLKPNENIILYRVMISPVYNGGNKQLKKHFQSALSQSEIMNLQKIGKFTITMFVTKKIEISDITFDKNDITEEQKQIITKGLKGLTNWQVGMANGTKGDGIVSIKSPVLLE